MRLTEQERQKALRRACAKAAFHAVAVMFDAAKVKGFQVGCVWSGSRVVANDVAKFVLATPLRRIPKAPR